MGLDNGLGDTEEGCAANFTGVHQFFHISEISLHETGGDFGFGAGEEDLFQFFNQELSGTLQSFQHYIAGKAIGNDHVGAAHHCVTGFNIAGKEEPSLFCGLLQEREGVFPKGIALFLFRADIKERDSGFWIFITRLA